MRAALADGAEAFETLVFRYQKKAQAIARALGVSASAVEDVVQESFLKAFRELSRLRNPASFAPWFLTIVRNAARQHLRKTGEPPFTPPLDSWPRPSPGALDSLEEKAASMRRPARRSLEQRWGAAARGKAGSSSLSRIGVGP